MADRPPKVVKIKRDGIEYTSKFDRSQYYILELQRAALREVGRYIRVLILRKVRKRPGLKKSKRPPRAYQYWQRKRENDLVIGIKHNTWYGVDEELGLNGQPKLRILFNTVFENIQEIRRIEGKYLSAIEDENKIMGLLDDGEGEGDE